MSKTPTNDALFLIPAGLTRPYFFELYQQCEDAIFSKFNRSVRPILRYAPDMSECDENKVNEILRREFLWSDRIRTVIVAPTSSHGLSRVVAEIAAEKRIANRNGEFRTIPVIALTLPFHGARQSFGRYRLVDPFFVASDGGRACLELGEDARRLFRQRFPKRKRMHVLIIHGEYHRGDNLQRVRHFMLGLTGNDRKHEFSAQLEITEIQPPLFQSSQRPYDSLACEWNRHKSRNEVAKIITKLTENPGDIRLDVIFAANDEMALGARDAIRESLPTSGSHPAANAIIYGFDAIQEFRELMNRNDPFLRGTVRQDTGSIARELANQIATELRLLDLPCEEAANERRKLSDVLVPAQVIIRHEQVHDMIRLDELSTIPPFDPNSGAWIREAGTAEVEGVMKSTLVTYRKRGSRHGNAGRDIDGRIWRRISRGEYWYLECTLKKA